MKKLSKTEAALKKSVAYKKACNGQFLSRKILHGNVNGAISLAEIDVTLKEEINL